MMRSLFSGVSGLKEHQTMMDVVGDNIANVNTVGYKTSRVTFEEMIAQTESGASAPIDGFGGTNAKQVGLGVKGASIDSLFTQGNLENSTSSTDLAIQGNGFFVLRQGTDDTNLYTRNGSFKVDAANQLVNASGLKVQGWAADANGNVGTSMPVSDITIPLGELMTSKATESATYTGNLNSGATADATSDYTNTLECYDSLGNSHLVTLTFEKTASNEWSWTASGTGITVGGANTGVINFDTNGNFVSQTGNLELDTTANGAVSPLDINLDFSGTTQFGTADTITVGSQDGYAPGVLDSYSIGTDGIITGTYSNGSTRTIAELALATFRNSSGLVKDGDSMYTASSNSGLAQIGGAMTGTRGSINSGELEMSNVDLSTEFTNMIIGERGFQANSKIITTADDMLNTLVNMKR
jgi:flagellar hook protein FlgE